MATTYSGASSAGAGAAAAASGSSRVGARFGSWLKNIRTSQKARSDHEERGERDAALEDQGRIELAGPAAGAAAVARELAGAAAGLGRSRGAAAGALGRSPRSSAEATETSMRP